MLLVLRPTGDELPVPCIQHPPIVRSPVLELAEFEGRFRSGGEVQEVIRVRFEPGFRRGERGFEVGCRALQEGEMEEAVVIERGGEPIRIDRHREEGVRLARVLPRRGGHHPV